jgi:hypothetical protein
MVARIRIRKKIIVYIKGNVLPFTIINIMSIQYVENSSFNSKREQSNQTHVNNT